MNNKKKLAIVHFIGLGAAMFFAMQAHYIYDDYPSLITSLLFPVNESIWEHTKLFVLPIMLVYLVVYLIIGRKFKNYIPSMLLSLIYMPALSCISFQIYLSIVDTHHELSGIIFSAIILTIGFLVSYFMTIGEKQISKGAKITILLVVVALLIVMAVCTYYPPKAPWLAWLFRDNVHMGYGIIQ